MTLPLGNSLVSPLGPFGFAGATGPPAAMPSLQALQTRHLQGLFRSNSAAARMMAMHKLTGGTEPIDFGPMSAITGPSSSAAFAAAIPTAGRARLARNNTVAGEERVAARQQLLRRLNERIEKTDVDVTSGSDDTGIAGIGAAVKNRRRRSRRKSGSQGVVDDRDLAAAIGLSPAATPTPNANIVDLSSPNEPAFPSSARISPFTLPAPSRTPSVPQEKQDLLSRRTPEPDRATESTQFKFDTPLNRRGVVVEEEDDVPMRLTPPRSTRLPGLPTPPSLPHTPVAGRPLRAPHASDAPSLSSDSGGASLWNGSGSGLHVPVILSDSAQRSPYRQDVFPKSPFGTPIKERAREEEDDRVLYPDVDGVRPRVPRGDFPDRDVSWVADPGKFLSFF